MTFKYYFEKNNGYFIAFENQKESILIIDKNYNVTKKLHISNSLKNICLSYDSLFLKYMNENHLEAELQVMTNGYEQKDWLFLSNHEYSE